MLKLCTKCNISKDLTEFWHTKNAQGEVIEQQHCKICKKKYRNQYERENRIRNSKRARDKTFKRKGELVTLFGGKCVICEGKFHQSAMDFHHVEDKVEKGVSGLIQASWDKLVMEASKCVLVCSNCHRFIHHEGRDIHNDIKDLINKMPVSKIKYLLIASIKYAKTQTLTSIPRC